jgi:hypothetical protein
MCGRRLAAILPLSIILSFRRLLASRGFLDGVVDEQDYDRADDGYE